MRKEDVPKVLPKAVPKGNVHEGAREFLNFYSSAFRGLAVAEQDRYLERFSITICVGLACVISSFFYWFLPPLIRVLVVPFFIGAAWWAGAKFLVRLDTRWVREPFAHCRKAVELRFLLEAIAFSAVTYAVAAIPFLLMPSQFEAALESANARTLFLGLFIWNLIGAPLFAQTRDRKARLLLILIFGVSAATATICWEIVLSLLDIILNPYISIA